MLRRQMAGACVLALVSPAWCRADARAAVRPLVSGPPLHSVGVGVTRAVRQATGKPVIGAGGVGTGRDAWQYLSAGASLVAVGTASFADPRAPARIARELEDIARTEAVSAPS